jgi:hypothetical protein
VPAVAEEQREMTIKEAIEEYDDLHSSVLALYLRKGRIKGRQIGKTWLINRESLEEYLKSNRKPGVKPGKKKQP